MRIADAQWIPSTQHQTWDALTDPRVLQKCIPGCVESGNAQPDGVRRHPAGQDRRNR